MKDTKEIAARAKEIASALDVEGQKLSDLLNRIELLKAEFARDVGTPEETLVKLALSDKGGDVSDLFVAAYDVTASLMAIKTLLLLGEGQIEFDSDLEKVVRKRVEKYRQENAKTLDEYFADNDADDEISDGDSNDTGDLEGLADEVEQALRIALGMDDKDSLSIEITVKKGVDEE